MAIMMLRILVHIAITVLRGVVASSEHLDSLTVKSTERTSMNRRSELCKLHVILEMHVTDLT